MKGNMKLMLMLSFSLVNVIVKLMNRYIARFSLFTVEACPLIEWTSYVCQ